MKNNEYDNLSDEEKKLIGIWCFFCGKNHAGQCEKVKNEGDNEK